MVNFFQKKYLWNIIFSLTNCILLVFIVIVLRGIVFKNIDLLVSLRKDSLVFEKERESFKELKNNLEANSFRLEEIDRLFTDKSAPVGFIDSLEKASKASGFEIKISPTGVLAPKGDPFPSLVFQISGRGNPQNFLRFLEKLENSPYLTKILGLDLRKTESNENNIEADLSIKVYANDF